MAVTYNFCIAQGTDCTVPFVLSDAAGTVINLTGFTAAMQLRVQLNSIDAEDTFTTENGRIEITPEAGQISCSFPHTQTENYPARTLVYDLEITSSGGEITRVVQGKITVSGEVTRV